MMPIQGKNIHSEVRVLRVLSDVETGDQIWVNECGCLLDEQGERPMSLPEANTEITIGQQNTKGAGKGAGGMDGGEFYI